MKVPTYFDGAKFATKYGLSRTDFRIDGNGELVCPAVPAPDLSDCVYDPVALEAEEKARAEKAAALETLADWMQRNPAEAVKLLELPAKVAVLEGKVAAIKATATAEAK